MRKPSVWVFLSAWVPMLAIAQVDIGESFYQDIPPVELMLDSSRLSFVPSQDLEPVDPASEGLFGQPTPLRDFTASQAGNLLMNASLAEAMELVWQESPELQGAQAEIIAAGHEVSGAYVGYLPFLQLQAAQGEDEVGTEYRLSVVQPLWNGGLTSAGVKEAKARRSSAYAESNIRKLNVGENASALFFQLALAEESSAAWLSYIEELQRLKDLVQRRADQGASPPNDIELAQVRLQQAEAGLARSQGQKMVSRSALRVLSRRRFESVLWPSQEQVLADDELAQHIRSASKQHPQRLRAVHEKAAQSARTQAAKAARWPTLNLEHTEFLNQQDGDFAPERSTRLVLSAQTDQVMRARRGARAEAQRVFVAEQEVRQAERDILNRIQAAAAQREAAKLQYKAQLVAVTATEFLVQSSLRRFKVGKESWLAVVNARREAHEALLQALTSKHDFWVANTIIALHTTALDPYEQGAKR